MAVAFDAPYPRPPVGGTPPKVPFDASPAPIPGGKVPFDAVPPSPPKVPFDATSGGVQAKPAAPSMPPGATDMGNNLVKLANGQMVPRDHPIYLEAMKSAGLGPAAAPAAPTQAQAPGLVPTPAAAAPQNTQQVLTGAPQAGPPTTAAGAFQQAMLSNLAPAPVTADSDSVRPQIQANQLAQQRGAERQRAQNAERNAAQGTSMSGGSTTEQIGLEQDRAAQEGQFSADAIAGQTDKDRQAQLLMSQLAGGMLTGQGAQDVSRYGIDTGAATSRYGIDKGADTSKYGVDANTKLGEGDLALRGTLGKGQLNLGLAGLLQNGDQFNQGLSSNNAQFSSNLNQQAILKMLGL